VLLDSVNAALDLLLPADPDPATPDAEQAQQAREFLLYKLYAAFELGKQVRDQLPAAMSSWRETRHPKSGRVSGRLEHDRGAKFMLYVLVDAFLFEAGSIRDALAQVANAIFTVGVEVDRFDLGQKVLRVLEREGETSGLKSWFQRPHPPWRVAD